MVSVDRLKMRFIVRVLLVGVLGLSWLLVGGGRAQAHANLVRSEPAADAVMPLVPSQVRLWFSEELEPGFSEVLVLDKNQARVDRGDSRLADGDRTVMAVSLGSMPQST